MKETNPIVWGAIGAVLAVLLWTWLQAYPEMEVSGGISSMSFAAAAGAGFFWGWAAGSVKNWLGRPRKP